MLFVKKIREEWRILLRSDDVENCHSMLVCLIVDSLFPASFIIARAKEIPGFCFFCECDIYNCWFSKLVDVANLCSSFVSTWMFQLILDTLTRYSMIVSIQWSIIFSMKFQDQVLCVFILNFSRNILLKGMVDQNLESWPKPDILVAQGKK